MRAAVLLVFASCWSSCSFTPGSESGGMRDARSDTRPIDTPSIDAHVCAATYATAFNGHHYRRTATITLGWADAQADCAGDGGHLIVIDDLAEDQMLATLPGFQTSFMWIGLHDPHMTDVLEWVDGSALTFNRFPGGTTPSDLGNQDCADRHSSDGQWSIYMCGFMQAGVCECE